ncbi:pimeloyl-ACP methyl ester carboxylesterase [Nonomuraea thailandensis]|uniref:Pimeloyl-ACP methyl ester carboxylesterase n=1 Tax=Nonomuraea thailandensis TaxID=1188745 RepID=A0A9X2K046_9ACTN|nr:alpha/beta hydrolase [Nonomuraea thailandensis]MCP2355957.1 pimeloyl-ACP methyl ester carboxylesterase [Nonomuraea thailandensis]
MTTTTTGTVTSADGTTISYREVGQGPGLVIVHGAMQTGHTQIELAGALAGDFTCYLPDRRGRGGSGPAGADYGLAREIEDLEAVLRATGARYAAGVSSGAVITLHTALARPAALSKAVLFEPPLGLDATGVRGALERFDREIAAGRVPAALVTGMRAARLGPPLFNALPRRVQEWLTGLMLRSQDGAAADGPTFRELAPTQRHDIQIVAEAFGGFAAYGPVEVETLLLGGGRSQGYLRSALVELERVMPRARRVVMEGLDHGATQNAAQRGRPERVAEEIRRFLKG